MVYIRQSYSTENAGPTCPSFMQEYSHSVQKLCARYFLLGSNYRLSGFAPLGAKSGMGLKVY